jgi:hypothetical protein
LWALHVTKGLTEKELVDLLAYDNEYVRSWSIQFLVENKTVSPETLKRFAELAKNDNSAIVRLYLTSAMIRIDPSLRWDVLEALTQKTEDKDDHNLPLMLWYASEPLSVVDTKRALQMAETSKMPKLLPYTIQRVTAIGTEDSKKLLKDLKDRLGKSHSHETHESMMLLDEAVGK